MEASGVTGAFLWDKAMYTTFFDDKALQVKVLDTERRNKIIMKFRVQKNAVTGHELLADFKYEMSSKTAKDLALSIMEAVNAVQSPKGEKK